MHLFIEKLTSSVSSILCSRTRCRYRARDTARILTNDKTCITTTVGVRHYAVHTQNYLVFTRSDLPHSFISSANKIFQTCHLTGTACVCVCASPTYTPAYHRIESNGNASNGATSGHWLLSRTKDRTAQSSAHRWIDSWRSIVKPNFIDYWRWPLTTPMSTSDSDMRQL